MEKDKLIIQKNKYNNKRYIDDVTILEESIINFLDNCILDEVRYNPSRPPQSLNEVFRSISELDFNDPKSRDTIKLIAYNVGNMPNRKQEIKKFIKIIAKLHECAQESEKFWTSKAHTVKTIKCDGITITYDNASVTGKIARGTAKALGTTALGAAMGTGKLMRGAYNMAKNAFTSKPQNPTVPEAIAASI